MRIEITLLCTTQNNDLTNFSFIHSLNKISTLNTQKSFEKFSCILLHKRIGKATFKDMKTAVHTA